MSQSATAPSANGTTTTAAKQARAKGAKPTTQETAAKKATEQNERVAKAAAAAEQQLAKAVVNAGCGLANAAKPNARRGQAARVLAAALGGHALVNVAGGSSALAAVRGALASKEGAKRLVGALDTAVAVEGVVRGTLDAAGFAFEAEEA